MTLDPERALQGALLAALRAAPELQPLLGTSPRVYDAPPDDPIHPYVLLGRSGARPFGGEVDGGAEGAEHTLTLTCVSRFGGAEEAKAVVAVVRERLHEAALTLDSHRLVSLRAVYADTFRASDWRSTFGVLRMRAVTEPLA